MRLALGAVVELVLTQLLLAGEGLQTAVQADGLSLGPTGLFHTAVLLHDLQGDHCGQDTFTPSCFFRQRLLHNLLPEGRSGDGYRCLFREKNYKDVLWTLI